MIKILKVLYRVAYTLIKLGVRVNFNSNNTEYIVWAPSFFTPRFLHGDNFPKTMASYKFLIENNKSCSIYTRKNIGKFNNRKIIIIGSHIYNIYGFNNHVDILFHIVNMLEAQGNTIYPDLKQVKYWENKVYMHKMFDKLNINTPKSYIVDEPKQIYSLDINYPFLIKEPHSCSANGLYKIESKSDLDKFIISNSSHGKLICQTLLNIRRDLRVILVGEEIILHYFRINLDSKWRPTSTGYGSKVDFKTFPDNWRNHIIDIFSKLKLHTGAFDIAWDNDDMSKEPYILEVSPFYQPNPVPNYNLSKMNYGEWKKSFSLRGNNYNKKMIDILFKIQEKYIKHIVNEKQNNIFAPCDKTI